MGSLIGWITWPCAPGCLSTWLDPGVWDQASTLPDPGIWDQANLWPDQSGAGLGWHEARSAWCWFGIMDRPHTPAPHGIHPMNQPCTSHPAHRAEGLKCQHVLVSGLSNVMLWQVY